MKKRDSNGKGPPPKANGKSTTPPTTPARSRGGITVMNRSGTPPPSGGITLIGKKAEGITLIGKNAEANGGVTLIGKKAEPNGGITLIGKKADANKGVSLIRKSQSSNELPPQALPPTARPVSQGSPLGNAPAVALIRKSHSATDIAASEMEELRLYSEEEVQDTAKIWVHLTEGASVGERQGAAAALAGFVKANGIACLEAGGLVAKTGAGLQDTKNPLMREGSLRFIRTLCEVVGVAAEPYVVPMLSQILMLHCDKWIGVRSAAEAAASELIRKLNKHAVKAILPILFAAMESPKFWQAQEGSLKLLGLLAETAPDQLRASLPEVVPRISNYVGDGKKQVMDAAYSALEAAFSIVGNRDIANVIPDLVSCVARPAEVPKTVHKLSGTTFVQTVTSSTLSVLVPLLVRGLKERTTLDKRRTVVVIENMSKLVKDAVDAAPFIPQLLPGLEKVSNEVADPECRERAGVAYQVLFNIDKEAKAILNDPENQGHKGDAASITALLKEVLPPGTGSDAPDLFAQALEYVAGLCVLLLSRKSIEFEDWSASVSPYVAPFVGSMLEAEKACRALVKKLEGDTDDDEEEEEDDEEGEDLCNVKFSLGYGGKILLNNSRLHLKRNRRYGLCGHNGCGKSTLMRAMATGKLDGFPPPDELRTVYVAHDLDASEAEHSVVDLLANDPLIKGVSRDEICRVLSTMGFDEERQQQTIAALSGGWKMKLSLGRAMLMKADILLLDEPTNHMDVTNVAWLENYLNTIQGVSSIIVSHDSGFLDNVCTDIIHYEKRKLIRYKGNLSEFVKQKPEAKAYYDLNVVTLKFLFPTPKVLDGILRRDMPIVRLKGVEFTYEGAEKPQLVDVNVQCTMESRVAVLGPNGAGKSTLIKILTGQYQAQKGTVWRHPNLGIAYVAQHAFHHVEEHMEMSPSQYICWRYETGEDKEEQNKVTRRISKEEQRQMEKMVIIRGEKRNVEKLVGRRKYKKTYEYEVKWVGMHPVHNAWMTRAMLEEMGFQKMIHEVDAQMVAKLGLYNRPLTIAGVQQHLSDFGLEPEFGTYGQIKNLSGGQKVKVVLAAAMWANPHMIVLDEPTNYLDREALGALATALKEYQGAVVVISHNRDFMTTVCTEEWHVGGGKVIAEGNSAYETAKRKAEKEAEKAAR